MQLERRVTNLEQWSHDVAETVNVGFNAVKDRVENLGALLVMSAPPARSGM